MLTKIQHLLRRYGEKIALLLIVFISLFFYVHNLNHQYLTLWDEAVHANVIKNLSRHCCVPHLLPENLNTDFRNWTDNYVWLHKPLLPFYISAAAYRFFGSTLFAMRLPAAIAAELIVVLLFWLGRKYFHPAVGLIAALLMAFNPYTFEQVQGRQFSGLSDILFAFLCIVLLALIIEIQKNPQRRYFIFFGIAAALAYLSKGGLTFIPFGVLGLALLLYRRIDRRVILNFLYAVLVFLVIIAPEILYLARRFPNEYAYEEEVQINHLFMSVEYWGRPWDYYVTVYLPQLLSLYLVAPFLAALGYGVTRLRKSPTVFIVSLWILAFAVPLSFGVSKISNFIYAIVPAALLLVPAAAYELWQQKKFLLLATFSLSAIVWYVALRLDLYQIKEKLALQDTFGQRAVAFWLPLAVFLVTCVAAWVVIKIKLKKVVLPLSVLAVFLVVWSFARQNWSASNTVPWDATLQNQLKQTALALNNQLPKNAIVLTDVPQLQHSDLFYLYWSKQSTLEVYQYHPISYLLQHAPKGHPLYVVSNHKLTGYRSLQVVPIGWLYKMRGD